MATHDVRQRLVARLATTPVIGGAVTRLARLVSGRGFSDSEAYWIDRYAAGGDSGAGSHGGLARYKATYLNRLVEAEGVSSVLELGCGDGQQLALARYPAYVGFDVSPTAIELCRKRFASDRSKMFHLMSEYAGQHAELALSLDVIYHLTEDSVYDDYLTTLFGAGSRLVVVYSTDTEESRGLVAPHVRNHKFTDWVEQHARGWRLDEVAENPYAEPRDGEQSNASFHLYRRHSA